MKQNRTPETVELIPIDRITVINPRIRNRKSFKDIVENVGAIGLKKPITLARRDGPDGTRYDLVCGQGRLEAYQALGETEIPAIVRNTEIEVCLLHSLVENCARRRHDPVELLHDVSGLKQRGYSDARVTGFEVHLNKSEDKVYHGLSEKFKQQALHSEFVDRMLSTPYAMHFYTEEEREQRLPSGESKVFVNRVAWAKSHLKAAGLLENPSRA